MYKKELNTVKSYILNNEVLKVHVWWIKFSKFDFLEEKVSHKKNFVLHFSSCSNCSSSSRLELAKIQLDKLYLIIITR